MTINYSLPIFDYLQDCWDPISEENVEELEADLGIEFPDDYREFLLAYNAGHWRRWVSSRVRCPAPTVNEFGLIRNFGVVADDRFSIYDLQDAVQTYGGRISDSFVPIMATEVNIICIETGSENYGAIYLWNRFQEYSDENPAYLVADSFSEFLLSLYSKADMEIYLEKLPIFQAVERGQRSEVEQYLADGGKADCRNAKGHTLLMCAARCSWPKIVRLLLEHGADPNAADRRGRPPLFYAIRGHSLDSAKLLVAAGADIHIRSPKGRTLAEIARDEHSHRIRYFLEECMGG